MRRLRVLALVLGTSLGACSALTGPTPDGGPPAALSLAAAADLQAASGFACAASLGIDLALPGDLEAQVAAAPAGWFEPGTIWIGSADDLVAAIGGDLIGQANGYVVIDYGEKAARTSDVFHAERLGGRETLRLYSRDRAARC